jgi:hypothetical protein
MLDPPDGHICRPQGFLRKGEEISQGGVPGFGTIAGIARRRHFYEAKSLLVRKFCGIPIVA